MGVDEMEKPDASKTGLEMDRLADELAGLKEKFEKALVHLTPQPDDYARAILEEFERDRKAYEREETKLLEKHRGQFVAFCGGKLVAVASDRKQVIEKAIEAKPTTRPYIRQVGQEIPSRPSGRR